MNTEYFELQIGGFFCGFTRVRLEHTKEGYFLGYYPGFANPEDAKKEALTEEIFLKALEEIYTSKLWDWEEEYEDPDVLDGTQWTLRLKLFGEDEREWYGSNRYPQKEEWNALITALNKLPIPPLDYQI